ncbi:MAG: glyoxalase [Nitratireductor sp.]|nr:glyoxalase [Nitratireductor sp.]MCB1459622.1 glyoxalase [Nitratireductor sp.]
MQFDHLTIRTRDLGATKAFFEQVLDLSEGERPAIIRRIPGYWLFDGNRRPVVHLIGSAGGDAGHPAEAIDHVGIRPDGSYSAFRARLERLGIPYSLMDVVELQERRVFFHTPGGPLMEAVFDEPVPIQHNTRDKAS